MFDTSIGTFDSLLSSTVEDHSDVECIGTTIVVLTRREQAARARFHSCEAIARSLPNAMNDAFTRSAHFEWLATKHDLEEAIDRFYNPGAFQ